MNTAIDAVGGEIPMVRLIQQITLLFLLMSTGCTVLDSAINDPKTETAEHNVILHNRTGVAIDEVRSVIDTASELLAGNMESDSSTTAHWSAVEHLPSVQEDSFSNREAPYFILIVSGQEIPVTVARLVYSDIHEIHEELPFIFDEIAFFNLDGNYYFSPQPDYLVNEMTFTENIINVQYRYLPQVRRWLRQREGQLLFAAGLETEKILEFFPDYTGDIPWGSSTAVISCETIFFEDVRVELLEDYRTAVEIRESNELTIFTPEDVMIVSVDHARFLDFYYRYKDMHGNVHRQYVNDQFRDSNNGGIITSMLSLSDEYFTLMPVE